MSDLITEVSERDHQRGVEDAPITLVAYCDFECPDCADGYFNVKQLLLSYGDRINYVFRHLPLVDIHPAALSGARFAEAAGKQGKFWTFHDFLYENQYLLEHPHRLIDEVSSLGIDVAWLRRESADPLIDGKILEDVNGAKLSGVTGTPTYFVNGQRIESSGELFELSNAVDALLANLQT